MCATKEYIVEWVELRSSVSAVDWVAEGGGKWGRCEV